MEQRVWTLRGYELSGLVSPPPCDSPVQLVALHGWLDNCASFLPLAQAAPHYVWTLIDLPGHGNSSWLGPGQMYHFIDWIAAISELLLEHFDAPVVLVGHSMGAGIAPLVAATVPERVRQLFLIDGLGPLTSPHEEAPSMLRKSLQMQMASDVRGPQRRYYATREEPALAIARARDLSPGCAYPLIERGLEETPQGWRLRHDPRLKWASRQRLCEEQVGAFLSQVTQPTTILAPSRGHYVNSPSARERQTLLSQAWVEEMEGGHHVHLERPELIAQILERSLRVEQL